MRLSEERFSYPLWILLAVGALVLLVTVLIVLPDVLISEDGLRPAERLKAESDIRTSLVQALGGSVLALGLYFTARTLHINREGQLTERFSRAIEHLGDDKLAIRLGGIYALERIARDSPRDHEPIMEVLTAFLREHAKSAFDAGGAPAVRAEASAVEPPTVDVRAILTVIARRPERSRQAERRSLDLRGIAATHTDLADAHLESVILIGAQLERADLSRAHLEEANLNYAYLRGSFLEYAHLALAHGWSAHFEGAFLADADLQEADFTGAFFDAAQMEAANLERAKLQATHLSGANLSRARMKEVALRGADLEDANLYSADLEGAYLTSANLEGAILVGAHLRRAHLDRANLKGADLNDASLQWASLRGANLDGAALHGADLTGTDLTGAKGLAQNDLDGAIMDSTTVLPEGITGQKSVPPEDQTQNGTN